MKQKVEPSIWWIISFGLFSFGGSAGSIAIGSTASREFVVLLRRRLIAGCILVFVPSLGAFLAPDLLGGAKSFMIGSLIEEQFKGAAGNWPFGARGVTAPAV